MIWIFIKSNTKYFSGLALYFKIRKEPESFNRYRYHPTRCL